MAEKVKKEKKTLTEFEKWFRTLHRIERFLIRPLFPYKRHGHVEYFDDRNYIIVCNHYSVLDVILAAMATTKPVHFIAKKELFEKGLMKKFVNKCECIPVNRDGNDLKAVMQAMKYLKNGENVVIFPEGKRNRTDEIFLPFKSGAATLSIKTKTPIIPVVQIKKLRFLRKSHVIYGEPIEFSEFYDKRFTEDDVKRCDEILRNKMLELHAELTDLTDKKKKKKNRVK